MISNQLPTMSQPIPMEAVKPEFAFIPEASPHDLEKVGQYTFVYDDAGTVRTGIIVAVEWWPRNRYILEVLHLAADGWYVSRRHPCEVTVLAAMIGDDFDKALEVRTTQYLAEMK